MNLGLRMKRDPKDLDSLIASVRTDADNGGDVDTAKSTSGGDANLTGPNTFLPIAYVARKQTATSQHPGEAEIVSLRDVITIKGQNNQLSNQNLLLGIINVGDSRMPKHIKETVATTSVSPTTSLNVTLAVERAELYLNCENVSHHQRYFC